MVTAATTAFSTNLYRGGSGTPKTSGQLIEECTTVECPEQSAPEVDVTNMDSAAAEFIARYIDNGEITVTGNYKIATGQELLRGDLGAAAGGYYVNTPAADGQQLDFSCIVTRWKLTTPIDGQLQFEATLKVTGAMVYTAQS